jgi:hypothetical protein
MRVDIAHVRRRYDGEEEGTNPEVGKGRAKENRRIFTQRAQKETLVVLDNPGFFV